MKNEVPTEHDTIPVKSWAGMFSEPPVERTPPKPVGKERGPKHSVWTQSGRASGSRDALPYGLTPTELAIVEILADGATNLEVARERGCAVGTVKVHLSRIFRKLGVDNRGGVIAMAKNIRTIQEALLERARISPFQTQWIHEDMTIEDHALGTVLFRRGEHADALYYLEAGQVHLPEAGALLDAGSVFGEIGVFADNGKRTSTAICETSVRLYRVSADRTWELYVRNPYFAAHLLRLAASRIVAERERGIALLSPQHRANSPELVTA